MNTLLHCTTALRNGCLLSIAFLVLLALGPLLKAICDRQDYECLRASDGELEGC